MGASARSPAFMAQIVTIGWIDRIMLAAGWSTKVSAERSSMDRTDSADGASGAASLA